MNQNQINYLDATRRTMPNTDISREIGISPITGRHIAKEMVDKGYLLAIGEGGYRRYTRTEKAYSSEAEPVFKPCDITPVYPFWPVPGATLLRVKHNYPSFRA